MNFWDAFYVVIDKLPLFIRILFCIPLLAVIDDVEDDYN